MSITASHIRIHESRGGYQCVAGCHQSPSSSFAWIWQAFIDGKITLCYTTEILLEYQEILSKKSSPTAAARVIQILLLLPNTERITTYYQFNLITQDVDDNKFTDCCIAAGADCIITNDRHFNVVRDIPFPQVVCVKADEFAHFYAHYRSQHTYQGKE